MISVTQAKTKMTNEDNADVARMEPKIDEALLKYNGAAVHVDCQGVSLRARNRLVSMYEAGGWNVEIHSGDQRDPGPWFTFTPRAP